MIKIYSIVLFGLVTSLCFNLPALAQTKPISEAEEKEKPDLNYVGIGGNIGLASGESALGSGGFAIVSRTGITDYLSIRSSLVIGEEFTSATALTGRAISF